jgi:hypothetical protein
LKHDPASPLQSARIAARASSRRLAFLREPLLHFFLIGAAIFALFAFVDDGPPPVAANRLEVTAEEARNLAAAFEATWLRRPTAAELDHMIGERLREEVYVREALALGLDRDDTVIRQRLRTKMEFLTESGAGAVQPDEATLAAHLAAYPDRFAEPPLMAFAQILLDTQIGPEEARLLAARLDQGADPGAAARPTLLPSVFGPAPAQVVDGTFGAGFFATLEMLPPGAWSGPVETPLGLHLVRVIERQDGRLPALPEIRARVEQDWRAEVSARLREERFEALLGRYEVVRPDAAAVLGP